MTLEITDEKTALLHVTDALVRGMTVCEGDDDDAACERLQKILDAVAAVYEQPLVQDWDMRGFE
jgi:hypothetical protein